MKILAGKLSTQDAYMIDDATGYFSDPTGNLYAFQFEVVTEDETDGFIRLTDSVGRMVPIDFSELGDVVEMMARIQRFSVQRILNHENLMDHLVNKETWLQDELRENVVL